MPKGSHRASFFAGISITLGLLFGGEPPLVRWESAMAHFAVKYPPPEYWPWPTWLPVAKWGEFQDPAGTVRLWSYDRDGANGPHRWGEVLNGSAVAFPQCGAGQQQSPINIATEAVLEAMPPGPRPVVRTFDVRNYTLVKWPAPGNQPSPGFQVRPAVGNATWMVDGAEYVLLQWHYHSPSEHTVNGRQYPLEGHFVYQNVATGELAVWGVLYPLDALDRPNPYLEPWWDGIYFEHGLSGSGHSHGQAHGHEHHKHLDARQRPTTHRHHAQCDASGAVHTPLPCSAAEGHGVDLEGMVNDVHRGLGGHPLYYRYDGSLTTPPCTETVKWHVSTSRTGISSWQKITYLYSTENTENQRETQPLNGRQVSRCN